MSNMERPNISAVVVTYKPDIEKLKRTIESVIKQKRLKVELVICDDGSPSFPEDEIKNYCEKLGFYNFVIVANSKNKGTVKNIQTGLLRASGKWIKLLSPGDYLINSQILYKWVEFMEENRVVFSFSNVVYYTSGSIDGKLSYECSPQNTHLDSFHSLRRNYLINDDLPIGAATLVSKDVLEKYIGEITDKVIYAEDNCYRLMIYDNVPTGFFPNKTIYYEVGCGVSTSGAVIWRERLKHDWLATNKLLITRDGSSILDKFILVKSKIELSCIPLKEYLNLLIFPTRLFFKMKKRFFPRKTKLHNI